MKDKDLVRSRKSWNHIKELAQDREGWNVFVTDLCPGAGSVKTMIMMMKMLMT